ncbi:hypothetical protein TrST_g12030 [Triparma strigata]|nr:hypothetical protein TrST_g12030 [Triparma strigata]
MRSLPTLSTTNEKSLAPIYRWLLLFTIVLPIGPSLCMVAYPNAPYFELVTQVYFAPCQGAVAIYLVSRLDNQDMPTTEKLAYFCFFLQSLLQGIQRLLIGRTTVGISLLVFSVLYAGIYKVLRRLRKRLVRFEDEKVWKYICYNIFRTSMQAMVPIVYLSSESLGCIFAKMPETDGGFDTWLSLDYKECGNIVTSNHAMAFHLSMLLVVRVYILPFEKNITTTDIKNWNLGAKHQILLIMCLIASLCALFIFATRREGTNKYTYINDVNLTHVLLMILHCCWGVVFVTFSLDAIVQAKRAEEGRSPKQEKIPYWNKWLSKDDNYALAPIYRYFFCTLLLLLPAKIFVATLTGEGTSYKWISVVAGSLSFHLAVAAIYIASNPRRKGYPLRELFVYVLTILLVLVAMLYNEINKYAFTRPIKVAELAFGVVMLIVFWPIVLGVRGLIKHMPNQRLKRHIRDIVFRGSSAFFSPLLFITMESINCPLTMDEEAGDYDEGACDAVVVPCSTMCHHIFFALMFNLYLRPHVVLDAKKIMMLDGIPWYRALQLICMFIATIVSLYVYATRASDVVLAKKDSGDLADLSYTLRNASVVAVFFFWTLAFLTEMIVIRWGIERVEQVAEIIEDEDEDEAARPNSTSQISNAGDDNEETVFHEALSPAYTMTFKIFLYGLGVGSPLVHIFYRNYFSYYFMTLIEVPVLLSVVMVFASSPKSFSSVRSKLFLTIPYPIFNFLFLLGDIIAAATNDDTLRRKEGYTANIAGRVTIIFCSAFCYPLISDTATRIAQSLSPERTERFLNSVFSRAVFMMIPLLYLTFEASAKVLAYLFLRNDNNDNTHTQNSWSDNGYDRPYTESLAMTCHTITFHLVMSWCLLVFVAPFKRQASTKELYMFNLSWHMRLQLSAAFVGSICSLILFAVRHVWTWNTMNKGLSLLCKTTWFVIIVLEVREIKQEERSTSRNLTLNDLDDNRFGRKSQAGGDEDEYANELELCEF